MTYDLSSEEVRVLGALIEKQNTTPDYYPLTLNSLLNACNQKSNREPVLSLDERSAMRAIDALRDRQLAWMVTSSDARVPKYEHNFDKQLGLTLQEVAVLCVLFLRGPQTVGEIRARCARIYPFENMSEVTVTLNSLFELQEPMACKLPLLPGRKETRYAHLFAGMPDLNTGSIVSIAPLDSDQTPNLSTEPFVPADCSIDLLDLNEGMDDLHQQVKDLSSQVDDLRAELKSLTTAFQSFRQQFD